MSDNKIPTTDGYSPHKVEKGYQPAKPNPQPTGDPDPKGGYIPTTSGGDNPANNPSPPGDE